MSVVINRSEAANMGSTASKLQTFPKVKPRTYDDNPLPIQASDYAPRKATIINRVFEGGLVMFELKIGETVISEVGLDEVLDYVSAYHLEEYENAQFQEEEELLKIAEEEDRRFKEEQHERRKERAKTKGTVVFESNSNSTGDQDAIEEAEVNTGKHGRARPSYKPLYNVFKQRRQRRKRDPKTGELIPLSDDVVADMEQQESSEDDRLESKPDPDPDLEPVSLDNLPRRRRRRRDPVTGELLPLKPDRPTQRAGNLGFEKMFEANERPQSAASDSPEKAKRPRRRRHPITNELMPLGWRYDPTEEQQKPAGGLKVSSMQRLSLSNGSEPKRRRLAQDISSNEQSRSPDLVTRPVNETRKSTVAPLSAFVSGNVISLHGSDSDEPAGDSNEVRPAAPKPKLLRRGVGGATVAQTHAKSQSPSESPEPTSPATLPVRTSPRKSGLSRTRSDISSSPMIPLQVDEPASSSAEESEEEEKETSGPQAKPATSIMHPSAVVNEVSSSEESSDDGELPEDEYFVEDILAHAESNPLTHPAHLGKEPVMLYKVKWEGWPEVTWEPETSFGNMDVVRQYQQRVGLTEG
jgi:hypothetical protein